MARAGGQLRKAQGLQFTAHRRLAHRDAERLPDPLRQIDQPPAHDAMDGRDRTALDGLRQCSPLLSVQFRGIARRLAVDQPIRSAPVKP